LTVVPFEGFYTAEQQRELVHQYLGIPHGGKRPFLLERGISHDQIRRWRKQVLADTLELGLVPRGSGMVSVEEAAGLKKLLDENRALKEQLATSQAEHRRELAAKNEALRTQLRAVDALGKAIEILHRSGERKTSTEGAAEPRRDHT
jgi:hypothetical protein